MLNLKRKATAQTRKPRADSARNRQLLINAAKAGFAEVGLNVSLEEIARRAGVGIGTLYRHFPSREAGLEPGLPRAKEQLGETPTRRAGNPPARGARPHTRGPFSHCNFPRRVNPSRPSCDSAHTLS